MKSTIHHNPSTPQKRVELLLPLSGSRSHRCVNAPGGERDLKRSWLFEKTREGMSPHWFISRVSEEPALGPAVSPDPGPPWLSAVTHTRVSGEPRRTQRLFLPFFLTVGRSVLLSFSRLILRSFVRLFVCSSFVSFFISLLFSFSFFFPSSFLSFLLDLFLSPPLLSVRKLAPIMVPHTDIKRAQSRRQLGCEAIQQQDIWLGEG